MDDLNKCSKLIFEYISASPFSLRQQQVLCQQTTVFFKCSLPGLLLIIRQWKNYHY